MMYLIMMFFVFRTEDKWSSYRPNVLPFENKLCMWAFLGYPPFSYDTLLYSEVVLNEVNHQYQYLIFFHFKMHFEKMLVPMFQL